METINQSNKTKNQSSHNQKQIKGTSQMSQMSNVCFFSLQISPLLFWRE